MRFCWCLASLTIALSQIAEAAGPAEAATPAEVHKFHVIGEATYRCYAGYSGIKVVDEMTKQPCDNKTYKKIVVDKVISIKIEDEPDPDGSKELAGVWDEKFNYQGRTFEIAITLFKSPSPENYRVRLVAVDNEPVSRNTAVYIETKKISEMNPISLDYSSAGQKEEIRFFVEVKHTAN